MLLERLDVRESSGGAEGATELVKLVLWRRDLLTGAFLVTWPPTLLDR